MSERYTIEHLLAVVHGDRELLDELFDSEILMRDRDLTQSDLERARLAWCLIRELEVNLPGVDIILRMREALVLNRRTLVELAARLSDRDSSKPK